MKEKNKVKVLLVEDNPADQRLVEIYLQESTMIAPELVKVTELNKGLLQLEEGDFDIVLLDLTLPDSSGFATIKTMLEEFPKQTVIVMTGLEDETVALNSVKAGAQDFIVKVGSFYPNGCKRIIFCTPEFILKGPVIEPVGMVHGKYDGFTFGNIFNMFHFDFDSGK